MSLEMKKILVYIFAHYVALRDFLDFSFLYPSNICLCTYIYFSGVRHEISLFAPSVERAVAENYRRRGLVSLPY